MGHLFKSLTLINKYFTVLLFPSKIMIKQRSRKRIADIFRYKIENGSKKNRWTLIDIKTLFLNK